MSSEFTYRQDPDPGPLAVPKQDLEVGFIEKLRSLKYTCRDHIRVRLTVAELNLMEDLMPLLIKRAASREISGLSAYES